MGDAADEEGDGDLDEADGDVEDVSGDAEVVGQGLVVLVRRLPRVSAALALDDGDDLEDGIDDGDGLRGAMEVRVTI